ncbi:MAG TPA: class I SAM-dependent methyltransferase, partial [Caldilineaceae bacterium]|nr:class I SAM-dependent methyltransferase [Caldilineaceae bacterium]
NIRLVCQDLMALDPDRAGALGDFDYIIAHGVYSWVPAPVRDRLLALCKQLLRPNGIVYISYNTYPGWHVTGIVRDAMLFHAAGIEEPRARAAAAREMIQFLADSVAQDAGAYSSIFQNYLKVLTDGLKGSDDSFLLHDELEETNDPVYFTHFVNHAARHGLQYLVEAELREVLPSLFKPEVQAKLQQYASDAIALEQYMDFLRNRMFRQTLLCHADVPVQRMLRPEPVFDCLARTNAQPAPPDDPTKPPGLAQFRNREGATLTTDHAVSAAAMTLLGKIWPQALPFAELLDQARIAAGPSPTLPQTAEPPLPDDRMLAGNLLRAFGYSSRLVGLHTYAPVFTVEVGERPLASPVARQEAMGRNVVTNVWHERVTLQPFQCHLLIRLDGRRTRAALLAELRPIAEQLNAQPGGSNPLDEAELERQLQTLAQAALLVG